MFFQTYLGFLICILLCFTSLEHVFCYSREGNYLNYSMPLFRKNNFIMQENDIPHNNGNAASAPVFNVLSFGAKGDGKTNDVLAFQNAWNAACKVNGGVILVPTGFTFLLQPITFEGINCQHIVVQVEGNIVAPLTKSQWVSTDFQWILFIRLRKGLTISGKGVIDGRGQSWWAPPRTGLRPHALRIADSINVTVIGITIQNSPFFHIYIDVAQHVRISRLTTSSPGDSPNTDGIHVSGVQHADIQNCNLACGDDCVSIQTGSSDIKISNCQCNPGHGYSIGGLGPNRQFAQVSDVIVLNSLAANSLTGVRIKTWPGGRGSVRNVTFLNVSMSNVQTAITIDQNYCGGPKTCPIPNQDALAIFNVTYKGIIGTYTFKSVSLICSQFKPCRGINIADINLLPSGSARGGAADTICSNAFGKVITDTTPPLDSCLKPETRFPLLGLAPAPAVSREARGDLL